MNLAFVEKPPLAGWPALEAGRRRRRPPTLNCQTMNTTKHSKSWCSSTRVAIWLPLLAAVVFFARSPAAEPEDRSFRVGFSHVMFTDVNENDAKAAVEAWGQTIAKQLGIPTDPEPLIFPNTPALLQALQAKSVDAVGITMLEYVALSREVSLAPLFVTYNSGRCREQYLLLVHRDSKLEHLSDLRGKNLVFHSNSRTCMVPPWLDTLLVNAENKPAAEWLGKITQSPKLSHVVLPVFFHQIDACVATRAEFETMCELNPQIGQQLKILARSPEMVASLLCFRADYAPAFKEQLLAGLRDLHKTPAGLQILTVFQSEKIEDQPVSCVDSALTLLAQQAQLTETNKVATAPTPVKTPQLAKAPNL